MPERWEEPEDWVASSVLGSATTGTALILTFYDPLSYVTHMEGREGSEGEFCFRVLESTLRAYIHSLDPLGLLGLRRNADTEPTYQALDNHEGWKGEANALFLEAT